MLHLMQQLVIQAIQGQHCERCELLAGREELRKSAQRQRPDEVISLAIFLIPLT